VVNYYNNYRNNRLEVLLLLLLIIIIIIINNYYYYYSLLAPGDTGKLCTRVIVISVETAHRKKILQPNGAMSTHWT